MKWYKKQLDRLKKVSKAEAPSEGTAQKKELGNALAPKKNWADKKNFVSPVAASKLSRPKTAKH